MAKVILQGYILVPTLEVDSIEKALQQHIRLTRREQGCITFCVERAEPESHRETVDDTIRFNVYEEFTCREAFEFHQQRVKTSSWGAISKNVSRHYTVLQA